MKRTWLKIFALVALGEVLAYAAGDRIWLSVMLICVAGIFVAVKRRLALVLIAFILGMGRMTVENIWLSSPLTGNEYIVEDIGFTDRYTRLTCGRLMVYTEEGEYGIGNHIKVYGDIEEMEGARNPGEFDYAIYYRSKRITHRCFADKVVVTDDSVVIGRNLTYKLRSFLLERISAGYDDDDAGFLRAALLGDRSMMNDDLYDMYKKNGIAHLLAISGLHVSIMGLGLYKLLRKKLSTATSGLIAGIWLVFYSILAGSAVSTIRAVIMLIMLFIADSCCRTYDQLSSLGLAGCAIILYAPYELFSCSFLLSFSAVASIGGPAAYFNKILKKKYEILNTDKRLGRMIESLVTSLSVQICTLPVTSYFFFEVSTYGFIINLIVIPLMTYVVWSGLFSMAIPFMGGLAHYILLIYNVIVRTIDVFPARGMLIGRPTVVAGLILSSVLSFGKNVELDFIDVGQGDGIYLDAGSDEVLIDCGSSSDKKIGKNTLQPFLQARAVKELDKVMITHSDNDHISGIQFIAEDKSVKIKELYLPVSGRGKDKYMELESIAEEVFYIKSGDRIELDKGEIYCLAPEADEVHEDTNDDSLILLYVYGDFKAMLNGDAPKNVEIEAVNTYSLPAVTVLKCGHHGSRTSTSGELLGEIRSVYAVLSYGEGNRYGHPHQETRDILEQYSADVLTTADCGCISFVTDGQSLSIKKYIDERN